MTVDWDSRETHLLLNPRMPEAERQRLETLVRELPPLEAHVWIATSGTSGAMKLVALSKAALLASAHAVNERLGATARDAWVSVLPGFHVGGLGIEARASLSRSSVVTMQWDARGFAAQSSMTLSSLVPAQVRDLVTAGLEAPASIRAVVVGGGAMPRSLYDDARALGWPVLPSYGLSEACSQVATAEQGSAELKILSHMDVRVEDGRIALRSPSLLTGYGLFGAAGRPEWVDPKREGWFLTEDRGVVSDGGVLQVLGREGEFVKIGGESVDLRRLDAILDGVRGAVDAAVVAVRDDRLGYVIHLAVAADEVAKIRAEYDRRVLPFERARQVHRVPRIPRTALGKLIRGALAEAVGKPQEKPE